MCPLRPLDAPLTPEQGLQVVGCGLVVGSAHAGFLKDFPEGFRPHLVDASLRHAQLMLTQALNRLTVSNGRVQEGEGFGVLALDFPLVGHDVTDHRGAHFLVADHERALAAHNGFECRPEACGLLDHATTSHP